jgi:hypothetical protein
MHICDYRCLGENGHHNWPAPGPNECLCGKEFNGQPVYCSMHKTSNGKKPELLIKDVGSLPYLDVVDLVQGSGRAISLETPFEFLPEGWNIEIIISKKKSPHYTYLATKKKAFVVCKGDDETEVRYRTVLKTILMEKPQPIPDYGDLFPVEDFKTMAKTGQVMDDDGSGYLAMQDSYCSVKPINCFDIQDGSFDFQGYTHVLWFNK